MIHEDSKNEQLRAWRRRILMTIPKVYTVRFAEKEPISVVCSSHQILTGLLHSTSRQSCFLQSLSQSTAQRDRICSKFGDTLAELLDRHLLFVEIKAEECFIV